MSREGSLLLLPEDITFILTLPTANGPMSSSISSVTISANRFLSHVNLILDCGFRDVKFWPLDDIASLYYVQVKNWLPEPVATGNLNPLTLMTKASAPEAHYTHHGSPDTVRETW